MPRAQARQGVVYNPYFSKISILFGVYVPRVCKSGSTGNCESSRSLFLHASEHVLTPQRFTAPESTVPFGTGCASLLPKLQRVKLPVLNADSSDIFEPPVAAACSQ